MSNSDVSIRSVIPHIVPSSRWYAGKVRDSPPISRVKFLRLAGFASSVIGTQRAAETSAFGFGSGCPVTPNTNGRAKTGTSDLLRGAISSSEPRSWLWVRVRPTSSRVSRIAVASNCSSPGSRRPPGSPMWPDQGSPLRSARRIIRIESGSPTMRATAASRISGSLTVSGVRLLSRTERSCWSGLSDTRNCRHRNHPRRQADPAR